MYCGVLDGLVFKITESAAWEVPNSSTYYSINSWISLNVKAVCNSKYRFKFLFLLSPGSTHDSTAYALRVLTKLLGRRESVLLPGVYSAPDDAYTCIDRLLTPSPDKALSISIEGLLQLLAVNR